MKLIAVLISNKGTGTNLQAIIDGVKAGKINAKIVAVISDTKDALGLQRARKHKLPIKICAKKENLLPILENLNPHYICLAGWKQIILDEVIDAFPGRILNVHPGLISDSLDGVVKNPDGSNGLWNRGKLTNKAIQNFLDSKVTYAGSTIHFLSREFDFGKVLGRVFEKIQPEDTVESLYARLKTKENQLYVDVLTKLCKERDLNVLVIGSNGREHALAVAYAKSKKVKKVIMTPGNGLTDFRNQKIKNYKDVGMMDFEKIIEVCKKEGIDLVDVGQDDIIAAGYVDKFEKLGIAAFGPTQKAAQLEWDKEWARNFMVKYKLPIPKFKSFNDKKKAVEYINSLPEQVLYVKAAGLAAGKGAIRAENRKEAIEAVNSMSKFGKAGETFIIEEALLGEEFSLFAICSSENFIVTKTAQDHKRIYDGDRGPNTGGVGSVAPTAAIDSSIIRIIEQKILKPALLGMQKEGRPYKGILYLGGMLTQDCVKIIEFNSRWGDPEAEVILPSIQTDYLDVVQAVRLEKLKKIQVVFDKKVRLSVAGCARGYPGDYSSVKGKEIHGLTSAMKSPGISIFGAGIKRERERFFVQGGRVFHLVAEGKDVIEARKRAYLAMALISIEGDNLHYRTDIGWRDVERMRKDKAMIQTVRVKNISKDLVGKGVLNDIHQLGVKGITKIESAKVYKLEGVSEKEAGVLAETVFCENIYQTYTLNVPIIKGASQILEIGYRPGVMNPQVGSILKTASDLGIKLIAADTSHEYGFWGPSTSLRTIEEIINKLHLLNPMVEHIVKEEPQTLVIKGTPGKTNIISLRKMGNDELIELSKNKLFLNLEEMKTIQKYFQKISRDPTDLELETLAQTWSEHCAHKTFKAKLVVDGKIKEPLLSRIKKEALKHNKNIVSAFVDNAGVADFYEGWAINGKAETHNAPSAIEPYGGAMTGSGGVFRDVVATGQGAKAVISTDIFCLAPPDMDKSKLPAGTLPPDYILKRVVSAVRDYGNRVGIPTNNGSFHFHEEFRAKPIVLVGAYGILPKKQAKKSWPKVGDVGVVIGGRTGRDGIHGATFSSGEMTERTIEVNATAVQIGNAIEEKRIFDAILEARDKNLIRALQDLGAGGFSSAIGEMGEKMGVTVHLEKAPLKYQGLAPWEIWVSESQERMLVVLSKKNLKKFLEVCKKYNVEATEIAKFDGSKRLKVTFGGKIVCDLDMEFLHHGLPQRIMYATKPKSHPERAERVEGSLAPKTEEGWVSLLEKVLSDGNINSKEPILRMYDHNVQGTNALHPFAGEGMDGPQDGAIIKPILDKPYGLVVSHGLNPAFTMVDPYWGTIWSGAEAISNYVAVGGDYKNASLINNYIWPNPSEEWLGKLDASVTAVCDFMKALKIPVISGKDSLSATYRGSNGVIIHSPPTLCMSVFGKIPDVKKTVSSDFKKVGSTIVLVGKTEVSSGIHLGGVPRVDLKLLPKVLEKVHKAIISGKVFACHDVSEGGLITSIFEMCVGGDCGATIFLSVIPSEARNLLFAETAGCFIVEVGNEKDAKKLFNGVPFGILGQTTNDEKLKVDELFTADIKDLQRVWQKPMKEMFS